MSFKWVDSKIRISQVCRCDYELEPLPSSLWGLLYLWWQAGGNHSRGLFTSVIPSFGWMEISVILRVTPASGGPEMWLIHADHCVFIMHSDWLGAWEATSEPCNCLSLGEVFLCADVSWTVNLYVLISACVRMVYLLLMDTQACKPSPTDWWHAVSRW